MAERIGMCHICHKEILDESGEYHDQDWPYEIDGRDVHESCYNGIVDGVIARFPIGGPHRHGPGCMPLEDGD